MKQESKTSAPSASASKKIKSRAPSVLPLLFIDTNILLDFYRSRNDAGISLLAKLDNLHDNIITSCQVEMEFKKNRQKAMNETISLIKDPDFVLATPAFLSESRVVSAIKRKVSDLKGRVKQLKQKVLATLENPKTHDRIYQTAQRLFTNNSILNLRHESTEYKAVWRTALKRFLEGRPPRKKDDTSAGDAINWEWIIKCMIKVKRDVIIVSRDADYGITIGGTSYPNNWLSEEVKERVSNKSNIILLDRLYLALQRFDITVTKEEIASESALIKDAKQDILPFQYNNQKADDEERTNAEREQIVADNIDVIIDSEEISALTASTNASGWSCDEINIEDVSTSDGVESLEISFIITGEQDEDKPCTGTSIHGTCTGNIEADGHITFEDIDAEIDFDSGDVDNADGLDDEDRSDDDESPEDVDNRPEED